MRLLAAFLLLAAPAAAQTGAPGLDGTAANRPAAASAAPVPPPETVAPPAPAPAPPTEGSGGALPLLALLLGGLGLGMGALGLVSARAAARAARQADARAAGLENQLTKLLPIPAKVEKLHQRCESLQGEIKRQVGALERQLQPVEADNGEPAPRTPPERERSAAAMPAHAPPPPPSALTLPLSPPRSGNDQEIARAVDAFNAVAAQPTPDAVDHFVDGHGAAQEGLMWHVPAGSAVLLLPGRDMIHDWGRQYRGVPGRQKREADLGEWYDTEAGDVLRVVAPALRQDGVLHRGLLSGA